MLTHEQKLQRIGKMTSSVVAGALGYNSRLSPLMAKAEILGHNLDKEYDAATLKAFDRGNKLEQLTMDYVLDVHPELRFVEAPFVQHPEFPYFGDSADGLYYEGDVLRFVGEGKTQSQGVMGGWGEEGTDEVPRYYLIQSHWHLIHHPEATACMVPVLVGGFKFEFRLYRVERNDSWQSALVEDAARWYHDHIINDAMPQATADDTEYAKEQTRITNQLWIADNVEIERWATIKINAQKSRKQIETIENEAANNLRLLLGANYGVKGHWGKVIYGKTKDKEFIDWERLARAKGATEEEIQRYTETIQGFRQLRVTKNKEISE